MSIQRGFISSGERKDTKAFTDFFKGIAILMVFLTHSYSAFDLPNALRYIPRFGQMGCQIFFALSAFGLCYVFANTTPSFLSHMKKRVSKLAVGFWLAIMVFAVYRILCFFVLNQYDSLREAVNLPGIIVNALFLHGLVPLEGINNTIVRGGWYVGTTVILYALFPLLHKVYYSKRYKKWDAYRCILFPLIVLLVTSGAVILLGALSPRFSCENNSFVYFSFVNQATPFALGIVLYDMCDRCPAKSKLAYVASPAVLIAAVVLFFGNYTYSFVFCQTLVALAFVLLFWQMYNDTSPYNAIRESSNWFTKWICRFGKLSFPIYLTHSFVAYEFSIISLKILTSIYDNSVLWYFVLLPVMLCLSYVIGFLFNKIILYASRITGIGQSGR